MAQTRQQIKNLRSKRKLSSSPCVSPPQHLTNLARGHCNLLLSLLKIMVKKLRHLTAPYLKLAQPNFLPLPYESCGCLNIYPTPYFLQHSPKSSTSSSFGLITLATWSKKSNFCTSELGQSTSSGPVCFLISLKQGFNTVSGSSGWKTFCIFWVLSTTEP